MARASEAGRYRPCVILGASDTTCTVCMTHVAATSHCQRTCNRRKVGQLALLLAVLVSETVITLLIDFVFWELTRSLAGG